MWEETLVKSDLEGQPRSLDISLPSFKEKADTFLIILIITSSASIIIVAVKFRIFHQWIEFLQSNSYLRAAFYPLVLSTVFIIAGIIFRTLIWFRYRPMGVRTGESIDWPFVSVIMPALNEEELIGESIDSIFSCNYPHEKFEVICINDGSTDTTLFHMLNARQRYGEKLKVINFPRNLGKRKALYVGVKKAKGEIILTADTDSRIESNAIRNLVLPLIREQKTGAVAGRVEVLNEKDNFLTRMLAIRYSISFNFGRAYQSVYGAVFCCPGALTAYRKDVLKKFIHEWVDQTFLNTQCTYGEDRALTTQILKAGYRTRFQSNAIVYTKVPSTFIELNKMYLRWTRSYIRESIIFAGFMFTKYRTEKRILPIFDFFFLNFLHPFHIFSLGFVGYSFFVHPLFILRYFAVLVVFSFLLSLYYLRAKRSLTFLYGIPYAFITAFCLWWIVPFAAFTMKNQSWMTR
ncbi:MAG: glycosyltransferase [Candidatus Aminicenantes bacterium]|nr:glycosyltransferase [Candidatus Aminicenantes bacterium]MDH5744569.1 glycosyltransferase [Candidatus Aminicenantes bacterium]